MLTRSQIRFSDLLSTSGLFRDFIGAPDSLVRWFDEDYRDTDSYRRKAEELLTGKFNRAEVARQLMSQNQRFGATPETLENIELLKKESSFCTIAGHQVILLGGPMMVFYKAMTVVKLAAKLSSVLARPVVPVFWLATDDNDFAEVDHIYLPSIGGKSAKITWKPERDVTGYPIHRVVLEQSIDVFTDEVSGALADSEFKARLMELLKSCYSEGTMIYEAFARLLLHHFGKHGLVIVDPTDPSLRSMARDVFRRAITEFEAIRDSIRRANASLVEAGYHLQVDRPEEYVNLFVERERRSRIRCLDQRISIEGANEDLTRDQILRMIDTSPESFSPDVLLRLIVQSKLFPAVAMVGGPAEIAYFAQAVRLFALFDTVAPIPYPRLSATVFERHIAEFVEKNEIDIVRLQKYDHREQYLTAILNGRFPDDIRGGIEESRMRIMSEFDGMMNITKPGNGLARTFEHSRRKLEHELSSLIEKIVKAHRKAHNDFAVKFRLASELLFPEQSLQERLCSFIYFANKYGPEFSGRIMEALDIDAHEHQIIGL